MHPPLYGLLKIVRVRLIC